MLIDTLEIAMILLAWPVDLKVSECIHYITKLSHWTQLATKQALWNLCKFRLELAYLRTVQIGLLYHQITYVNSAPPTANSLRFGAHAIDSMSKLNKFKSTYWVHSNMIKINQIDE